MGFSVTPHRLEVSCCVVSLEFISGHWLYAAFHLIALRGLRRGYRVLPGRTGASEQTPSYRICWTVAGERNPGAVPVRLLAGGGCQ
jgi:hypothetical protein